MKHSPNRPDQEETNRLFAQAPSWVNYISFDVNGNQSWWEAMPRFTSGGVYLCTDDRSQCNVHPFHSNSFENNSYYQCLVQRPLPNLEVSKALQTKYFKNKKSGDIYLRIALGIDCTNSRDGTPVVIYYPNTFTGRIVAKVIKLLLKSPVFVRAQSEFSDKFESL